MKSSFSRNFYPAILVLLMVLCSIGLLFQIMAKNLMEEQTVDGLKVQADTVAKLAVAYHENGTDHADDFFLNLSVAARVSQADTVICDPNGKLLICSENPMGCSHQGLQISKTFLEKVYGERYTVLTGKAQGLYTDARYMVCVPVRDAGGETLGIVIASTPVSRTMGILRSLSNIYLTFLSQVFCYKKL